MTESKNLFGAIKRQPTPISLPWPRDLRPFFIGSPFPESRGPNLWCCLYTIHHSFLMSDKWAAFDSKRVASHVGLRCCGSLRLLQSPPALQSSDNTVFSAEPPPVVEFCSAVLFHTDDCVSCDTLPQGQLHGEFPGSNLTERAV